MLQALAFFLALRAGTASGTAQANMLTDLNAARVRAGLSPLRVDAALSRTAYRQCLDMVLHRYFDHRSSDGRSPFERIREAGLNFLWAGENIAISPDEGTAFRALTASPEHLENMLQPNYEKVGIAAVQDVDGQFYFVQDFTN